MSASNKKQLRKEQNAAELTEKQQKQQAESKKLKIYTTIFVVVLAVILCIALVVLCFRAYHNSGVAERKTTALTVGEHQLTSADLNYFYIDGINQQLRSWQQNYGNYMTVLLPAMGGPDLSKPLSASMQNEAEGITWADYFVQAAIDNAKAVYAMVDQAAAEGFALTEEQTAMIDTQIESIRTSVKSNPNYRSMDAYLKAVYGVGASEEGLRRYLMDSQLASAFQASHVDALTYTDEQIRAYDSEHTLDFNSYTFAVYKLDANQYLTGGTVDEEGKATFSDKEIAASVDAAKADADKLMEANSVLILDKTIAQLEVNKDAETPVSSTKNENVLYASLSSIYRDWVSDPARAENDKQLFPIETTSTDAEGNETTKVTGYYVVFFQSMNDNSQYKAADVRHILSAFKSETDSKEFTDAEKKAALDKANSILEQWKSGEATEESFAALVKDNSDDTASIPNGGLFEDIYPNARFVKSFLAWAIAPHQPGDTGIVESEYGYHVMYYVGSEEPTYRDMMITNTLKQNDYTEWFDGIVDAATAAEGDTSLLNHDLVLARQ